MYYYQYITLKIYMDSLFTENEYSVWLALQSFGVAEQKVASILNLSKKLNMHRPALYKIIESLLNKGLIIKKEESKHISYDVCSLATLKQKIKEKEERARIRDGALIKEIESRETEMMKRRKEEDTNKNGHMRSVKGRTDIMALYSELVHSLGEQDSYYSFTTMSLDKDPAYYLPYDFRKVREKKNLWSYVIAGRGLIKGKGVRFSLEIKHMDDTSLEKDCLWLTYGDVFAFINTHTEQGYVIRDHKLAKFQQSIIKAMYERL